MYESLKEYFRTRGILLVIVIKARQTLRRHDHGWYLYKINFHWLSPLSIYTALAVPKRRRRTRGVPQGFTPGSDQV